MIFEKKYVLVSIGVTVRAWRVFSVFSKRTRAPTNMMPMRVGSKNKYMVLNSAVFIDGTATSET